MKYFVALSILMSLVIVTRKPKEPTEPTGPKIKTTEIQLIRSTSSSNRVIDD